MKTLEALPARDRDPWVDGLLEIEDLPEDVPGLPAESVPYLPCGVDEVLAAVREGPIGAGDQFVDVGSGLGRVALLVNLLTGARCGGVELQEPLVRSARSRAAALGLEAVIFTRGNAAEVELDGSVFFFYAPFSGGTLKAVLDRLEQRARVRPLLLCAVGLELPVTTWLRPRRSSLESLTLYDAGAGRAQGRAAMADRRSP